MSIRYKILFFSKPIIKFLNPIAYQSDRNQTPLAPQWNAFIEFTWILTQVINSTALSFVLMDKLIIGKTIEGFYFNSLIMKF